MARSRDATNSEYEAAMASRVRPPRETPRSRISSPDCRPTLIFGPHLAARVNLQFDALAKIGSSFPFEFSNFRWTMTELSSMRKLKSQAMEDLDEKRQSASPVVGRSPRGP